MCGGWWVVGRLFRRGQATNAHTPRAQDPHQSSPYSLLTTSTTGWDLRFLPMAWLCGAVRAEDVHGEISQEMMEGVLGVLRLTPRLSFHTVHGRKRRLLLLLLLPLSMLLGVACVWGWWWRLRGREAQSMPHIIRRRGGGLASP